MRYRMPVILAAVMAVIGLSAPAALAGPLPSANNCPVGETSPPYHIVTNTNQSLGITYHGPGNQATITSSPGISRFEVAGCLSNGLAVWVIHNSSDNCLRMHDESSGYGIFEEDGCDLDNFSEQWVQVPNGGLFHYQNRATGQFLGVSCPPDNGDGVIGLPNTPESCLDWQLNTP